MNSESGQKLSMDQLLEKNRPPQVVQEQTLPPKMHPTKAEWDALLAQMDELLNAVQHLERMCEQAGKRNEKRFSLPGIRLRLPRLDGPTWIVLLMGTVALLLLWWSLGTVWSSLSRLLL